MRLRPGLRERLDKLADVWGDLTIEIGPIRMEYTIKEIVTDTLAVLAWAEEESRARAALLEDVKRLRLIISELQTERGTRRQP